jgi:hypothetical protein
MAERTQSYKRHTRNYPLFHFIAFPILALNFLNTIRHVWLNPNRSTAWQMVVAFGLLALHFAARTMAVTVQDRVIRLEMQLRLARILPADLQRHIVSIRPGQFVALRFASDEELPELVREIVDGRLQTAKYI